jgi:F420-dependent oxidoreductase-like protein
VVGSDAMRALVGGGEDDLAASTDAFALLDDVVRRRVARRLTTVVDTLGLDVERRRGWLALAREHRIPCVAVAFDTPAAQCRARNRGRRKQIPVDVLAGQLRAYAEQRPGLDDESFDAVLAADPVRVVPAAFASAAGAERLQRADPVGLRFGLHLGVFPWRDEQIGPAVVRVARAAEDAGFDALWVMDHFRQIPQLGRAWEPMPESWTTLAYVAGATERIGVGTLVSGVTYRNVGHLGKVVATLDVLSGGRARCGLGLGWFEQEHRAYGWPFPPVAERYALLEDALRVLPMLWGPGSPAYEGRAVSLPDTTCYPRPLQEHVPLLVGGNGERRTLRLAAQLADGCNVMGDLATVRRKVDVLSRHCADAGRDPGTVSVTHLTTALVDADDTRLVERIERLRPRGRSAAQYASSVHAGTVADQVGRFRALADAGVREVMVRLPDVADDDAVARMGQVVAAFR